MPYPQSQDPLPLQAIAQRINGLAGGAPPGPSPVPPPTPPPPQAQTPQQQSLLAMWLAKLGLSGANPPVIKLGQDGNPMQKDINLPIQGGR